MIILRIKHSASYTCISNQTLRDRRLSFKARGIHHLLLSFSENAQVSINQIADASDKDGRDGVQSALRELQEAGYISRQKTRDQKTGKLRWEYVVSESPIPHKSGYGDNAQESQPEPVSDDLSRSGFPGDGYPGDGYPDHGFPDDGLPDGGCPVDGCPDTGKAGHIVSNELVITDQSSNELVITEKKESAPVENVESDSEPEGADAPAFSPSQTNEPEPEEQHQALSLDASPVQSQSKEPQASGDDKNSAAPPPQTKNGLTSRMDFNSSQRADVRMRTGHKYPDLVMAGLGHCWIGPGWADFLPELIEACARHLKAMNMPSEPSNAKNYIKNRIREADWAALELRLQEMDAYLLRQQQTLHDAKTAEEQIQAERLPTQADVERNRVTVLQQLWDGGQQNKVTRLLRSHTDWGLEVRGGRVVPVDPLVGGWIDG